METRDMDTGDLVEELIEKYRPMVYKMARRMCPWEPRDEDLLQCGLIGLWRAAELWDQVRPFPPLARRCVQGEMAVYMRRKNRGPQTLPLESVPSQPAQEDDYSLLELRDAVARTCPNTRKGRILLALGEGQSLSEAARLAGVRPARARQIAARALKTLPGFREILMEMK